ncbi:MAG TPA: hypothetical protein QGG93_07785, partial [Verrucomicrobiota bacterium]|nr:hypothetical protein [Verrucomicrobiota bacterium]
MEKRYDLGTGMFRPPPRYSRDVAKFDTSVAASEVGNITAYCQKLLDPKNAQLLAIEIQTSGAGQYPITRDRIRSLLVQATGVAKLSHHKTKEIEKAKHAERY